MGTLFCLPCSHEDLLVTTLFLLGAIVLVLLYQAMFHPCSYAKRFSAYTGVPYAMCIAAWDLLYVASTSILLFLLFTLSEAPGQFFVFSFQCCHLLPSVCDLGLSPLITLWENIFSLPILGMLLAFPCCRKLCFECSGVLHLSFSLPLGVHSQLPSRTICPLKIGKPSRTSVLRHISSLQISQLFYWVPGSCSCSW